MTVTDPGAVNYLVGIATPEPGAVDGKEILEAVFVDFHHMGRLETGFVDEAVGIF